MTSKTKNKHYAVSLKDLKRLRPAGRLREMQHWFAKNKGQFPLSPDEKAKIVGALTDDEFGRLAREALSLEPWDIELSDGSIYTSYRDAAMIRALFNEMGLAPEDPYDWAFLVWNLAFIFYANKLKGPKVKWTPTLKMLLWTLLKDGETNMDAAKRISKDKNTPFYGFGVSGLEKKIREVKREVHKAKEAERKLRSKNKPPKVVPETYQVGGLLEGAFGKSKRG